MARLIKRKAPEPKQFDETGWVKILDWGYTAEVYGRGNDRVMIDRKTGRVIIRFKFVAGGLSGIPTILLINKY